MKLDNVTFAISDLDEALDFFTHKLGLKKARVWDLPHLKSKLVEVDGENFTVKLMFDENRVKRAKEMKPTLDYPLGYAHMVFSVSDIDVAFKDLSARGVRFKTGIIDTPDGAKRAFFCGPDNIELEIVQHSKF